MVFFATKDTCMIRNPSTLNAKAKFNTRTLTKKITIIHNNRERKSCLETEATALQNRNMHTECEKSSCKCARCSRNLHIFKEGNKMGKERKSDKSCLKKRVKLHPQEKNGIKIIGQNCNEAKKTSYGCKTISNLLNKLL